MKNLRLQRNLLLLLITASLFSHILYGLETDRQIAFLNSKVEGQARELLEKQEEIELLQAVIRNKEKDASNLKYIGQFEITYYTAGFESTGKSPGHPAYGITRSGTTVKEGQTIATDWSILPKGTKVYIEGIGERIVEDTGSEIQGFDIDVYVERLEDIPSIGRHKAEVYIVN